MGPTANARPGCDGDYTVHISSASSDGKLYLLDLWRKQTDIARQMGNTVVGQPRTLTGRK